MSSECQLLERRAWDSSFQEIEVKEHVTLLPSYLGRVRQGVVELLSGRVLLYHSVYDGVLVSFSHVRILKRAGHIIDELPHIHMDIVYSATVFKPQVGAVMCGSVSMVGVDHVGCLVYNCFNVSVICTATTRLEGAPGCQSKAQKKKRWRSWCRRPFLVGEDVWFTVTGVEVTGSILAMRGEYMVVGEEGGGGGRVMVNSVDSSETSRDSAAVEESQSQPNMKHLSKKKIKKKKKCKNQRHKRVSGEDSGSESFSGKRKKKRRLEGEGREV